MNLKDQRGSSDDVLGVLGFLAVVYIIISVFVLFITVMDSDFKYVSADTVASKAFHLKSNKQYPFRYGKRIEGSSGYAEASSGLFSSYARVSLQPASALSVHYQYGRNSYILELPVSKIKFVQKTNGPSTIKLKISTEGYHTLDSYSNKLKWMIVPYFSSGLKPLRENAWFKSLKAEGQLGPLVQDYFQSATIRLNPKDYDRILNG